MKEKKAHVDFKLIFIALLIVVVPLLLKLYQIKISPSEATLCAEAFYTDVVSVVKAKAVIGVTILLGLMTLASVLLNEMKVSLGKERLALLIYGLAVIVSSVFSKFPDVALMGFIDHYEGVFTLLAYVLLALVVSWYIMSRKDAAERVLALFYAGAVPISIIAVSQVVGHNIINMDFCRWMIMGPEIMKAHPYVVPPGSAEAYATLGNPNFLGSYCTLVLPVLLFSFQFKTGSSVVAAGKYCAIQLLTLAWILSGSRAGWISLYIGLILYSVCFIGSAKPKTPVFVFTVADVFALLTAHWVMGPALTTNDLVIHFGLGLILLLAVQGSAFIRRWMNFRIAATVGVLLVGLSITAFLNYAPRINPVIDSLGIEKNAIVLGYKGSVLKIINSAGVISYASEIDKPIRPNQQGDIYTFPHEFEGLLLEKKEKNGYSTLKILNNGVVFFVKPNGEIVVANSAGLQSKLENTKNLPALKGLGAYGSGRVFIWTRTMGLLPETILLGKGPDGFALVFPQNDFVERYESLGSSYLVVDKPHNWYLQMAVNTGVASAVAVMMALGSVLVYGYRHAADISREHTAAVIALTSYSGAQLFNDSVVSVAPLFWIILGVAIGQQYLKGAPHPRR